VSLALSDETGFPHPGTINFEDNQLDAQTGTLRFRGTFPNKDHLLSPGLFIRVQLPIGEAHSVLVVPDEAVQADQGRKFVWVLNDKNMATYTPVEVGPPNGESMRVIESGLKPTDRVIVSGLQRVRPGAEVKPKVQKAAEKPASSTTQPAKPLNMK
jgi:RND family efflux transporter MFP subunit